MVNVMGAKVPIVIIALLLNVVNHSQLVIFLTVDGQFLTVSTMKMDFVLVLGLF